MWTLINFARMLSIQCIQSDAHYMHMQPRKHNKETMSYIFNMIKSDRTCIMVRRA